MYDDEIWKDVPGYEGLYQVSDTGRVRSLDRVIVQKITGGRNSGKSSRRPGRVMKQDLGKKGYFVVAFKAFGKNNRHEVHTLVARAFLGPLPPNHHTHRKNGDSTDNHLSNLVHIDATYHGHITHRGKNTHLAKLDEVQVKEIRAMLSEGYTQKLIAKRYGVARSTIGEIKRGASWSWL